jgi:serine phosphatase RsbU (regulator of sigma subunit)
MLTALADALYRREAKLVFSRQAQSRTGGGVLSDVFPSAGKRENIVLVNVRGRASEVEGYARYLRHVVRTLADLHAPGSLVECVNLALNRRAADDENDCVSGLFFAALHGSSLTYASGGHDLALLVHKNGRYRHLPPTGKTLGIKVAQRYRENVVAVAPGDWLFLASEGIMRARDTAGMIFGMSGFAQSARSAVRSGADDPAACILAAARPHAGGGSIEDVAVLCLRFS